MTQKRRASEGAETPRRDDDDPSNGPQCMNEQRLWAQLTLLTIQGACQDEAIPPLEAVTLSPAVLAWVSAVVTEADGAGQGTLRDDGGLAGITLALQVLLRLLSASNVPANDKARLQRWLAPLCTVLSDPGAMAQHPAFKVKSAAKGGNPSDAGRLKQLKALCCFSVEVLKIAGEAEPYKRVVDAAGAACGRIGRRTKRLQKKTLEDWWNDEYAPLLKPRKRETHVAGKVIASNIERAGARLTSYEFGLFQRVEAARKDRKLASALGELWLRQLREFV